MANKINYTGSDKWKQKATELLNQESGGGGGSTTIISVGYHDSQYQTINAAIAYARTICSESARVLIEIAPGIYYENINLHPNPGIDLIGYGAHIINNSESYPEAALFTNHTGSFTGLYFENLVEGAYALHVERDSTDKSGGVITFTDCSFISVYAGAGIGMSPGASIFMRNCLCQSAVTNAGLYLHNANTDGSAMQGFHALNCQFVARSGEYPVLIDDAIGVYGNTGTSQLMIDFQGSTGGVDKLIGVRDNPNTVDHDFTGKANLILKQESSGNYFPALNYYNSRYIVSGSQTSTSSEDEGINTYTFTYDDGTTSAFNVKNGSKGSQGIQGPKGDTGEQGIQGIQGEQGIQGVKGDTGDAAGFGTPTAIVDANVGTPSVSITSSGPDTAKIFNFEFHNLKGEQGTIPDLSAETIDTIDTIQTEYPTLTAGDKVSALFGKIKKFLSDLKSKKVDKAGDTMSGALTINGTSANTLDNMSYERNLIAEENGKLKWYGVTQSNVNNMYKLTGQNVTYIDSPLKVNRFIDSNNVNGMYVTGNNGSFCNVETNDITLYGSTANRVPVINADKKVVSSAVTDTELGYLSGVTSAIQTQIDDKQDSLFRGIPTATDFNSLTTPGIYWIQLSTTNTNAPFGSGYGFLEVWRQTATGVILQRFTQYSNGRMAERMYVNSQWYAWNNKAYMWTDGEGGNIQIWSKSGTYGTQMDMYNDTTFRIYHSSPTATVAGSITHSYNKTANLDYLHGVTSNIQDQINNALSMKGYAKNVSTNFNSITAMGIYYLNDTTMSNAPSDYKWSFLIVLSNGSIVTQIVIKPAGSVVYMREYSDSPGSWWSWRAV